MMMLCMQFYYFQKINEKGHFFKWGFMQIENKVRINGYVEKITPYHMDYLVTLMK